MDNFKGTSAANGSGSESDGSASVSFGRVIPTYAGLAPQNPTASNTPAPIQNTVAASTLPPPPQSPPPYTPPSAPQSPQKPPVHVEINWGKVGKIAAFALLGLLVVGAIAYTAFTILSRQNQTGQVAGRFTTVEIPLAELIGNNGSTIIGTRSLAVNGTLQANGPVVLSPSKQPGNATRGQMYYDQDNNQLAYFNGSQFIQVGATQTTNVQSLGGQTGIIAVGEGLASAGGSLSNSGVLSLQGQTGNVTLTAGNGIAIDGTTLTSTGVTSLAGLTGDIAVGPGLGIANGAFTNTGIVSAASGSVNITVTNDGNGNITISSVGGGTGTVQSPGGTPGRIAKFTGVQTIEDSLISESGTTVTINGSLSVLGGLSLANALTVGNGGTGATALATNGVVIGQGSGALTAITAAGPGLCFTSTAGAPQFTACPGASGVSSVNSQTGAVTIANASGSGGTVTINDAGTSQKGIASFNSTNFTAASGSINTVQNINVAATPTFGALTLTSSQASSPMLLVNNTNTSATGNLIDMQLNGASRLAISPAGNMTLTGTINGQTISNSANFTGTLAVAGTATLSGSATVGGVLTANTITPTAAMTVGATGQSLTLQGNASTALSATNGANTTTLTFQSPTANVNYRLLTAAGGTYDICTSAGNCAGIGGGVTTAGGTTNRLAKFTSSQAIGDSILTDDGATVSIGGVLSVNTITPSGSLVVGATTQNVTLQGATTQITATSGGITNALVFATPSGSNKTITLPNASGTVAVSASGPLAVDANGNITCTTCVTSGGGGGGVGAVDSLNGLTGALTIANSTGSGSIITIDDATTSQKGIASFNGTNFSVSGGAVNTAQDINTTAAPTFGRLILTSSQATNPMVLVNNTNAAGTGNLIDLQLNGTSRFSVTPAGNITAAGTLNGQTISSSANFTGSLAVATTAAIGGSMTVSGGMVTLGTTSQAGAAILYDGSSNTAALQTAALGQNTTYILPDPGTSTTTFCLTTGNCAGLGGGITGSGTAGKITKFTASGSIGDSILTETAGLVSVAGSINVSTGNTYQINGVQISSSALSNDTDLAKLSASQTFTGDNSFNGNVALGDAVTDTLTIGAVLQGATPLVFEGGSADANELSLAIAPLTTDHTVTLGDESGTICLQSSTNCGFAATTGGTGYIQNQTAAAQLANFYIQSAAAATAPTAALRLASGQTGNLMEFQDTSGNIASRVDSLGFMHIDRAAATSDVVFTVKSTADTQSRLTISADGKIGWGSGSAATDNFITRTVAGALEVSNQFTVMGGLQVGAAGFLGKFTIQGGNTNTVSQVIRAVASQTADQIQLQDSAGNINASFNNTGNQLTLGRVAASGTVTPGRIVMADGTTSNFSLTMQTTTLTANHTVTLPNETGVVCLQGSTTCGFAAGSGSANYIQNTTTQQTANMNIISAASGSVGARIEGAANMSAQALLVRAGSNPTANAFEVQNSSAGQIFAVDAANTRVVVGNGNSCTGRLCVGQSTSGAGGGTVTNLYNINSLNVSGISTIVGHNVVLNDISSSVANVVRGFVIDATGSTNTATNIHAIQVKLPASALGTALHIQNGSTDIVNISNSGSAAFRTTTDSTTGFTIQGNSGINVFTADTFNNTVRLRAHLSTNVSTYDAIWLQTPKNSVTAMIGGDDDTSGYSANEFSGNLRWNGSNVAWGDIGFYPQGGDTGENGHFRFSTTGSAVNTTPNAKVGIGELYVAGNAGIGTNNPSYKLHVVGSAHATTSVLTPLLDTASAGTLAIGTTNATGINLNQNTVVAATKTLTVTSGATSLTGATSGDALTVSNNTSTGNIAIFRDNATTVASIADGGATTFQNSTNGANAFRVLSQGGGSLFNIDATNGGGASLLGMNSGEVSTWATTSQSLPAARYGGATVTSNGYVYYIGGNNSSNVAQTTVYSAKLNSDGTVGTWSTLTNTPLPSARARTGATVVNGHVYVFGGLDASSATTQTVYVAKLYADGTMGTWSTTNQMPTSRRAGSVVQANGYVYYIGGQDNAGTPNTNVYFAKALPDGTLSGWTMSPTVLPQARYLTAATTANGYLYVMGGSNTSNVQQTTVYYSKLNSDGTIGAWTTASNPLSGARAESSALVMNGYVYVIGGADTGGYVSTVLYSRLNADGSVGSWTTATNALGANRASAGAFVANGYLYMAAGYNGSAPVATVTHTNAARVQIGASLDLVGLQGQGLADPGDAGGGSSGGSLTAGNGTFVGGLNVQGLASFNQGAAVNGGLNVFGNAHVGGDLSLTSKLADAQGFESTTFVPTSPGTWTTGGSTNWSRVTTVAAEGTASAGSGAIGDSQQSWLDVDYTFSQPGMVQFSWKVSSESTFDWLYVCVDDDSCSQGTSYDALTGEVDWIDVSIPVTAGTHSFRWVYGKDVSTVSGSDKGWVDNVRFTAGTGKIKGNFITINGSYGVNFDTGAYSVSIGKEDAVGSLFVLDVKTGSTVDPQGLNGAMYYNDQYGKFRCFENYEWKECITTPYLHRWYASGSQSVTSGTDTKINFATQEHNDGDVSVAGNNTFTLNKPGIWAINTSIRFGTGTGGTGERYLTIATCVASGQPLPRYGQTTNHQGGSYSTSLSTSAVQRFSDGDEICIYGYQNSSGALSTDASWNGVSVSFTWLGY